MQTILVSHSTLTLKIAWTCEDGITRGTLSRWRRVYIVTAKMLRWCNIHLRWTRAFFELIRTTFVSLLTLALTRRRYCQCASNLKQIGTSVQTKPHLEVHIIQDLHHVPNLDLRQLSLR